MLVRLLNVVLLGNILFDILNDVLLGMQNFRLSAIINIIIWISHYFDSVVLWVLIISLDTIILGWTFGIFLGVQLNSLPLSERFATILAR